MRPLPLRLSLPVLLAGALAVGGVFWFARNFVLFAYYRETVAVLDGGWFAGLLHGSDWKLTNPAVLDDESPVSYFQTHVIPFLIPLTYAARILPLAPGEYMAVFLGAAFAFYAALIFIAAADFLLRQKPPLKTSIAAAVAAPVAFVLALNGVSAEILHYPHFEAWIPIFVCAFLLAFAMEKKKTAVAVFILLVSVREDGGFHLAASLLAIVFFRQFPLRKSVAAQKDALLAQKELLTWSAAATACSLVAINIGGVPAPRPTVFDHRALDHLISILTRGEWLPAMIVVAAWAALARKPSALIGFAALIPWVLYSIPQDLPLRAHMASYYGFPVLTALFWPFVAGRFFPSASVKKPARHAGKKNRGKESRPSEFRVHALFAAAFAVVFAASTLTMRPRQAVYYNDMRIPKVGMTQLFIEGAKPFPSESRAAIRKLRDFFVARADELNIIAADGFASLHPHDVPKSRLLYRGPLRLEQNDAGILIAHATWLQLFAKSVFAARAAFDLRHAYQLRAPGDDQDGFFLFSKEPLCDEDLKCIDDLPLESARLGPGFYDLAGAEISRDSFYFPAPSVAAEGAHVAGDVILVEQPGVAAELKNLPLGGGRTAVLAQYFHTIKEGAPPRLEVEWADGGMSAELPAAEGANVSAGQLVVALPARRNVSVRVLHNGGGTLRVFALMARAAE